MDTDLSLIEMSGEDDSLLQQLPNDDACSVYSSSSFSPLCALKPPKPSPQACTLRLLMGFAVMEDSERSSMPTCKEGVDKENAIWNKPEMPKLSIEPQQMKRKKKGGCYNLRKSLAWDKAFFTEEGVLDSAELSMISGNLNSLAGEKLSFIHEEGRELLSEVPGQRNDLTNLPSCDEKLFKNFPVKATGGSKRTVGCYSPQKHNSLNKTGSITFTAKQRVLSAQGANMSVSEHNDNNIRVQSSLSIRKAVANSGFPGPSTKSSTSKSTLPEAKRNVVIAAKQSSSTQVKVASERPQDQVNRPVHHVPNGDPGDSSEMEVPLPQTSEKVDIQLPTVPIQFAKLSGLRMPSPSIRFFYQQPKSSAWQNLAKKYVHPKNIPQPTSATSRKPCSVKILQDMSTPLGHDQLQQLISNSPSRSSSTAPPALTDLSISSHKKLESDPEFYGVRKTEPRLHNFPTGSNSNNRQTMQNPSDVGKQDIEIVKPCEDNKQLSSHEGNLKLNEDEALLSLDPSDRK
ncbi:hypothetical protein SAY86_026206 [Trapa natans]|uniref:Uncharacterized protein n=1 Tax=Trapa natans TaxID=22666 RepID=A0AAN7KDX6_TRANT|nr:hypothetical protein SAY86_026206 [Trapa natans]